jgi:hypothetical protein
MIDIGQNKFHLTFCSVGSKNYTSLKPYKKFLKMKKRTDRHYLAFIRQIITFLQDLAETVTDWNAMQCILGLPNF